MTFRSDWSKVTFKGIRIVWGWTQSWELMHVMVAQVHEFAAHGDRLLDSMAGFVDIHEAYSLENQTRRDVECS